MADRTIRNCVSSGVECANKDLLENMQEELHLLQILLFGGGDSEGVKERLKGLEIMTDSANSSIQEVKGSMKTIGLVAERLVAVETNLGNLSRAVWTFVGIMGAIVSAVMGRYIYDMLLHVPNTAAQATTILGSIFTR